MNFNKIALGLCLSFVSGLAMVGCGNGVEDDPLAGNWSNTECYGSGSKPADVESCTTELTFTNELNIELKATTISLAATAVNPGCTTTWVVTGQTWSAEHAANTFTVAGKGESTIERSKCVNEADNKEATTTTEISIASGDVEYTITEDTLSVLSGSLKGIYTR